MTRREFPTKVRVAVIKRATAPNGVIMCEGCGLPAKRFQIDHIIADAHGGKPVIENAELICNACYEIKNPKDTTIAAKLKRIEAKRIGAVRPRQKIAQRPKSEKPVSRFDREPLKPLELYEGETS